MSLKELSNEDTVSSTSEINNNDDEAVASQGARNQETEEDSSEDMYLKELFNEATVSSASGINNNDDQAVASQETEEDSSKDMPVTELSNEDTVSSVAPQDDVNQEIEEVSLEKMTVEILVSKTESIQGELFRQISEKKRYEVLVSVKKRVIYLASVEQRRELDEVIRQFALAPHLGEQQGLQKNLVRQHEIEKMIADEFKLPPEVGSDEREKINFQEIKKNMEGFVEDTEKNQNKLLDEISLIKEVQRESVSATERRILILFPKYKSLVDEIKGRLANQGIKEEILPVKPRIEAVLLEFKKLEDQLNIPCFEASHLDQMLKEILHATDPVLQPQDEVERSTVIANSARLQVRNKNDFSEFNVFSDAISRGDFESVKSLLGSGQYSITQRINEIETPIHRACSCGHEEIVKEMLDKMDDTEKVKLDWKLLYMVIMNGNLNITEALLEKKPAYSETPMDKDGMLPIVLAAYMSKKDIVNFLYKKTSCTALLYDDGYQASELFGAAITNGMLDIALDMLIRYPTRLALTKHPKSKASPIVRLAACDALLIPENLGFWEGIVYPCVKFTPPEMAERHSLQDDPPPETTNLFQRHVLRKIFQWLPTSFGAGHVSELKMRNWQARAMLKRMMEELCTLDSQEIRRFKVGDGIYQAVFRGNLEYIKSLIKYNPQFLWSRDNYLEANIFTLAVVSRQAKIFNLYYGLDERRLTLVMQPDGEGETLLHVVAQPEVIPKGPPVVAPLELQRELYWYKEVENLLPTSERQRMNKEDLEPWDSFQENHTDLLDKAEDWMKGTATSCSVVAILIATVAFQAIFTIPEGVKSNSDHPVKAGFWVFVIADFLAFFFACTATFIFLGILTVRYSFHDFLKRLPTKMLLGQLFLLLSVCAMLVVFCTAIFTARHPQWWQIVIVVIPACFPIVAFFFVQRPIFWKMVRSTYGKGLFDRNPKRWF